MRLGKIKYELIKYELTTFSYKQNLKTQCVFLDSCLLDTIKIFLKS